jgi:amino acid adenylation domain-containing protein
MVAKQANERTVPSGGGAGTRPSEEQRLVWLDTQLTERRTGDVIAAALRMSGPLDVAALRTALAHVVSRYEPLRTCVAVVDGRLEWTLQEADPRMLVEEPVTAAQLEAAGGLNAFLRRIAASPLDPADRPVRTHLLRLADTENILFVAAHRIALDEQSIDPLFDEVISAYNTLKAAGPRGLLATRRQPPDGHRPGDSVAADLNWWRTNHHAYTPVELPSDRSEPGQHAIEECWLSGFALRGSALKALHRISREHRTEPAVVLLAIFDVLLHRYTGRTDLTVGVLGITGPAGAPDIGPWRFPLPVMVTVGRELPFSTILSRTAAAWTECRHRAGVPYPSLLAALAPRPDPARPTLFRIVVEFDRRYGNQPSMTGLFGTERWRVATGTRYDLQLRFVDRPASLSCELEWDGSRYEPATIARLNEHLHRLVAQVLAGAGRSVSDLQLISADERAAADRTATPQRVYVPDLPLHRLFECQVARTPDEIAVIDNQASLTYANLDAHANHLAWRLVRLGVTADTPVGILLDRSVHLLVAVLGVLKAGGAYLPIETDLPEARIRQLIGQAGARLCVTQTRYAAAIAAAGAIVVDVADAPPPDEAVPAPQVRVLPANLSSVYYTSGSTGQPKAVASTHQGWVNRMRWMQRRHDLQPGEAVLHKTTLSFDDAAVELLWPIMVGGRVAVLGPGLHRDPLAVLDAAIRHEVVHLQFVPSMLNVFLDCLTDDDVRALGRLRSALSSGEALHPATVRMFQSRFGHRVTLDNTWGATEVSIDSTCHQCGPADTVGTAPVSLGRPIENNEVLVLDSTMDHAPAGVAGELFIAGVGLARGYLNDPAATARAFVPHPWQPGERIYRTGDRGRVRPDGSLEFLGRTDHQVKIRGVRIELAEVEAALRSCPGVLQAAATIWQASAGDKRLAGFVTVADSATDAAAVRQFVRQHLPSYAVPSAIRVLDALPLLPNGKLNREALPTTDLGDVGKVSAAGPDSASERLVTEIWTALLGTRPTRHDNFFLVGGTRTQVIDLVERLNQQAPSAINVADALGNPTVSQLAALLDHHEGTRARGLGHDR